MVQGLVVELTVVRSRVTGECARFKRTQRREATRVSFKPWRGNSVSPHFDFEMWKEGTGGEEETEKDEDQVTEKTEDQDKEKDGDQGEEKEATRVTFKPCRGNTNLGVHCTCFFVDIEM